MLDMPLKVKIKAGSKADKKTSKKAPLGSIHSKHALVKYYSSGPKEQALTEKYQTSPEIVLADIALPGMSGKELLASLKETEVANQLVDEVDKSGNDVKTLCEIYDLKREELGRLTGFSQRALADWAAGDLPSQPAKRRLHEVRRLLDALSTIVKRESIKGWLHRQNDSFDNMTPLQVIEVGEMDRLWAMVHDIASGHPA